MHLFYQSIEQSNFKENKQERIQEQKYVSCLINWVDLWRLAILGVFCLAVYVAVRLIVKPRVIIGELSPEQAASSGSYDG